MVVCRQSSGLAGKLNGDQRAVGVAVEPRGGSPVRQGLQVGCAAEIGEEQETQFREILGQYLGDVRAGGPEERRNPQERAAVFLVAGGASMTIRVLASGRVSRK